MIKNKTKTFDFANNMNITHSQAVNKVRVSYCRTKKQLVFYDASRTVWEKEEILLADDTTTQRYNPTVFKVVLINDTSICLVIGCD